MQKKSLTPKKAIAKKAVIKNNTTVVKKSSSLPVAKSAQPSIFNIDEINQLLQAVNHSNVNELKLEKGDFKITIRQGMEMQQISYAAPAPIQQIQTNAPVVSAPAPVATTPVAAPADNSNLITIKSPMIGTFYRSSAPGVAPFVNVGDEIKIGSVLCVVEAMKLFNEIESEISGKIVKVLVDDTSPVEYDQPLFLVES